MVDAVGTSHRCAALGHPGPNRFHEVGIVFGLGEWPTRFADAYPSPDEPTNHPRDSLLPEETAHVGMIDRNGRVIGGQTVNVGVAFGDKAQVG